MAKTEEVRISYYARVNSEQKKSNLMSEKAEEIDKVLSIYPQIFNQNKDVGCIFYGMRVAIVNSACGGAGRICDPMLKRN